MNGFRRGGRQTGLTLTALLAAVACSLLAFAGGCKRPPDAPDPVLGPTVVLRNRAGKDWLVRVELAKDPSSQAKGLMYRWSLAQDTGMLFIYDRPEVRKFWMKNTRIPLDMIFIGPDQKIAGIVERAEPYTTDSRSVDVPSQWVLEVGGGEAAAHGVAAGDQVYFFKLD